MRWLASLAGIFFKSLWDFLGQCLEEAQGRADAQSAAVSDASAETQTVITEVVDDQRKIAGDAPADARVLSDRLRHRAATNAARDRGKIG